MAGRVAGITVEIGANATPLNQALKGVDAQLRNLRGGLRDVDRLMKFNPTSTQLITQKQQMLKQSIEQTKGRLDQLKEAQAKMDDAKVDKNSDQYQRLQREIMATEGKLKSLEKEYSQVASVAGVKLQAMGQQMKDIGAKIDAAGQAVSQKLTVPIVALGAASVKAFADVDKGMDSIVTKTGATGKELETMKESAKNLAAEIPTDFKTAGDAVGQVNTRFKLTGDELESVSGQFVKFAKMNNTDVTTSVNSVQSAMAAFGVQTKDTGAFLDTLNSVGQKTGADVNRLAQEMTTNAASLKAMGYSASDAAMFLGQLSVNGVDSSQVMAGLKKAFAQATKEGKPLDQKLAELQDTMKNAGEDTEAYKAALEVFGNRAGPALASAIRDGRLSLEQLGTSLQDNVGNIDKTFEETLDPIDKFKMMVNQAKTAGAGLGNALLTTLTPMLEKVKEGLERLTERFQALTPKQQETIVKIGLMVAAIGPAIMIIGKLTTAIGGVVSGVGTAITKIAALGAGTAGIVTPIMTGVAACGLLAAGFYALDKSGKAAMDAQHGLTEEQRASVDALNKQVEAYTQAQAAADEKNKAVASEFGHVRELKDEYNGLVDANGKIAEKDQARADVILGELASALGLEKSEIQELINKNGELGKSIDKVIAKKEAQAYLDANYDSYVQALQMQTSANQDLANAIQTVDQKEKEEAAAKSNLEAKQKAYDNALTSGARNLGSYKTSLNNAQRAYDSAKKATNDAKGAVDKYSQASADASTKISNYQRLQEAVQTGSMKKIKAAMVGYQNDLKTSTTATKTELDAQAKDAQKQYQIIQKAYDNGQVTKSALDASKKRADAAAAEAAKVGKSMDSVKKKVNDSTAAASKGASKNFSQINNAASKDLGGAAKKAGDAASNIKKKFPMSLGKLFSFKLPSLSVGSKTEKGFKIPTFSSLFHWHKSAYSNPLLFTSPTIVPTADGGHGFGDKSGGGGELVYGKNNLMNDIKGAVASAQAAQTINVYVDGAENPEAWADRFVREYQLKTRMA